MTRIALALVLLAASGCGGSPAVPQASTGPDPTVASSFAGSAAPGESSAVPQSAADLLECVGAVSSMGGRADDFGPDGAGTTPDEAFQAWMEANPFPVPRAGYVHVGAIGDRSVYAYEVDGRVKVVVVISSRFGEMVNAPFTIEEMRTCDPSEYGAEVDLGKSRRAWVHETTGLLLTDIPGPGHCGWESARMLHVEEDGMLVKQYLRDPDGVFAQIPALLDAYAEGVNLPVDAVFSGYRTADGLELWLTERDTAAYVVTPDGVERWPRAEPPIGCS
jgi:hypothetical protein